MRLRPLERFVSDSEIACKLEGDLCYRINERNDATPMARSAMGADEVLIDAFFSPKFSHEISDCRKSLDYRLEHPLRVRLNGDFGSPLSV